MGADKVIKIPDTIKYPKLFDLFEKQTKEGPESSRIYPYYENLSKGKLTTTKCNDCDKITFPPRILCPFCNSMNLTYVDIEKEGNLYAFASLQNGVPMVLQSIAPFNMGVVRFKNSGLQISGRIYGAKLEDLRIGDKVKWSIETIYGPGSLVRYFPCFDYVGR